MDASFWQNVTAQVQMLARQGLQSSTNPFDRGRFEQMLALSAEIPTLSTPTPSTFNPNLIQVPKLDIRAAVVRNHANPEILLVQELYDNNRYSLPGGWADVGATPCQMVEREVWEETGYHVRAIKLIGVYDRRVQTGFEMPCYIFDFLCELVGGTPRASIETGTSDFFALNALPELSFQRTQRPRLENAVRHFQDRARPTVFD